MEIYMVIIHDRHTDVEVHPFTDKETAINEAKKIAHAYSDSYEEYDRKDIGWLFCARCSEEGDSVIVVPATMDATIGL